MVRYSAHAHGFDHKFSIITGIFQSLKSNLKYKPNDNKTNLFYASAGIRCRT